MILSENTELQDKVALLESKLEFFESRVAFLFENEKDIEKNTLSAQEKLSKLIEDLQASDLETKSLRQELIEMRTSSISMEKFKKACENIRQLMQKVREQGEKIHKLQKASSNSEDSLAQLDRLKDETKKKIEDLERSNAQLKEEIQIISQEKSLYLRKLDMLKELRQSDQKVSVSEVIKGLRVENLRLFEEKESLASKLQKIESKYDNELSTFVESLRVSKLKVDELTDENEELKKVLNEREIELDRISFRVFFFLIIGST